MGRSHDAEYALPMPVAMVVCLVASWNARTIRRADRTCEIAEKGFLGAQRPLGKQSEKKWQEKCKYHRVANHPALPPQDRHPPPFHNQMVIISQAPPSTAKASHGQLKLAGFE